MRSKDRERVGTPSHMYQPFISEARHTPRVEKALGDDPFESVAAYNAAWAWAYEAARIAYAAGRASPASQRVSGGGVG